MEHCMNCGFVNCSVDCHVYCGICELHKKDKLANQQYKVQKMLDTICNRCYRLAFKNTTDLLNRVDLCSASLDSVYLCEQCDDDE